MASEEYLCVLRRLRTKMFGRDRWEAVTEPFSIRFDLVSTPSRMNGLLAAISRHLHRDEDFRGREKEIEQYDLQLLDAEGMNFETIYATAEQLTRHNEGYLASVEDGVPPRSLAGFSDEQLLAEVRRRLAERGANGAPDQRV